MTKEMIIENLNKIYEASLKPGTGYNYDINEKEWILKDDVTGEVKKSRTYLSIVETRDGSKHYAKKDFGFWDNINNKYVAGKNDLTANLYDFGDNKRL